MQIMICPNDIKKKRLLEESHNTNILNIKYMSPIEFFHNVFFSYDEKAIYYLMKKYHYPVDVCRVYLEHLYFIEDKDYSSKKLCFLRDLLKELKKEKLLSFNPYFKDYLKDKELIGDHLYHLDSYQEKVLGYKENKDKVELKFPVYEFDSLEEEVHFVCVQIRELIKKGIPLSKIYLCNVEEDYFYTLEKMFSYYHIPIEIPYHHSIYSTSLVQEYLKSGVLDLESDNPITKLLCNVLSSLVELEDDEIKREILIHKLKNTYLSNPKYEEAITIKDLFESEFKEDEYVFVLGFNQDHLPVIYKDIDYLNDQEKEEVGNYSTMYFNQREKLSVAYLLSKISNLTISYKLSSPFQKYYPSSMIGDYNLEVIREEINDLNYSDLFNQIRLGESLDQYYLYGEKDSRIEEYSKYYDLPYGTYDSSFKGINRDLYLDKISYPLRLSYTSINAYNECPFKYYVQYVLKLGNFEDTFAATVGSLYHKILSIYKKSNFNLDNEWNRYLEDKELSLKDTVLLVRIRKDLEELLKVLKEQQNLTGFDQEYYEKELKVKIRDDIYVEFVGYVDKIMTYQNVSDTYFAIVDYKTGSIDTHIEPMKYGLHMQLPIYLYLIHNSKLFDNPIFTGIYYQNILFSYPTWSEKIEEESKEKYYLKGYSTDKIDILSRFDSTYEDSTYIKSMKYDPEKGFNRFSKILNDDMVERIVEYTKNTIENNVQSILDCKFDIAPKVYGKENISCKYCPYQDICFMNDSDLVYLEKSEDFSFLGGEE